ncbi:MAG: RluA family pseudouridine synthase [Ruminococcus sp.]|nr:RluA family pseudouridine synthase [Ruminococcus sp.]
MITRLKREKNGIMRNGENIKTIDTLFAGDIIELKLTDEKCNIFPVKGNLNILFEDEYIIAVDKPYNMPVHPTKVHQEDTLANIVAFYQIQKGESYVFRAINRLDKDTSGIVVIAKDKHTAHMLFECIDKTYQAVCEGKVLYPATIRKPLKLLDGHSIQRTASYEGEDSVTRYYPIKVLKNHTFVEFKLETGHTHQIRCHMSGIGHPLAGDDMYGGSLEFINRQALHCGQVSFIHPVTKEKIEIFSELPADISELKRSDT